MKKSFLVFILVVSLFGFLVGFIVGRCSRPVTVETPKIEQPTNEVKEPQKSVSSAPEKPNCKPVEQTPIHPHDDMKYGLVKSQKLERTREFAEIRMDNYGVGNKHKVRVLFNKGGQELPVNEMKETISAVLQRMPNLKSTDNLRALMLETMIVETGLGAESVELAVKRYKNYGLCQFRLGTAKEMLAWLKATRPDVHKEVMSFYDQRKDLAYNLNHNVPFSIAMMSQLYWRVAPDIYANIKTLEGRAKTWKVAYNTHKGLGTINKYKERVNRFHRKHEQTLNVASK